MCIFPLSGIVDGEVIRQSHSKRSSSQVFFFPWLFFFFFTLTKDALIPGMSPRLLLCGWYNCARACSILSLWPSQQKNSIAPSRLTQSRHTGPERWPEKQPRKTHSIPPGSLSSWKEIPVKSTVYLPLPNKRYIEDFNAFFFFLLGKYYIWAFFKKNKITPLERDTFPRQYLTRPFSDAAYQFQWNRYCITVGVRRSGLCDLGQVT